MIDKDLMSQYIKPLSPVPTGLKQKGNLPRKVRCVLFDVYGTLFISGTGDISVSKKESQSKADSNLERLLHKYSISTDPVSLLDNLHHTIEKTHRILKTKGIDFPEIAIDKIWTQVLEYNDPELIRKFSTEFELIVNPVYPMPNLKKMLDICKTESIQMGIISNAQFFTPYLFEWFLDANPIDLGFHPHLTIYSYRFGYAKPSTFLFKVAADRLKEMGIQTDSVLYVGNDMLNDIYPAKSIGFMTALFAGDIRSLRLREDDPRCKNIEADLIITELIHLTNHLSGPSSD